jgi:hypothetical protein
MLALATQAIEYNLARLKVVMYIMGSISEIDVLDIVDCLEGLFNAAEVKRIH